MEFFERSKARQPAEPRRRGTRSWSKSSLSKIESRLTGNTIYLANRLEKFTGLETRITILGHLLRGGTPTAADRVLATNLGTACVHLIERGHFRRDGCRSRMASIVTVPLEQVIGKHKQIPLDHPWIDSARRVGTSLGD